MTTTPSSPIQFSLSPHKTLSPTAKTSVSAKTMLVSRVGFRLTKRLLVNCTSLALSFELPVQTGLVHSLLGEIGFRETAFLFEQNPSLWLADIEYVRTRVSALEAVGIVGTELCNLIAKRPTILTADEIDPFIDFVVNDLQGQIEPMQIKRLLVVTEPKFLVGFDQKVKLLLHHGIPNEKLVSVLKNVNLAKAICLKSAEEICNVLSYLKRFGGVDIIVRRPPILNYDLDTQLIPRVEFLKEISGGDENATGIVLHKLPAILSYSLEHTKGHVELLRSLGGLSDQQIFRIFHVFPNVISASRERKLRPRIQLLKKCGLNSDEIFKFLSQAPLFLGLSFEDNLAHKLVFLVKLGYSSNTKDLTVAMRAITRTSCENLQKVIGLFLSHGLSFADILAMSKKHPQVLQYRYDSLKEKLMYLIEGMGRDVGEILTFPAFLGYKLDDRIKHRYEVKRKIIGDGMSINKLLSVSYSRFSAGRRKKNLILDRQP